MSYELQGKIIAIEATQHVNDRFRKKEFVIEIKDEVNGQTYTNYAKMQCVQAKCDMLDNYNVGDNVKVQFNIKGNKWEKDGKVNYITSLDVWRIEKLDSHDAQNYDTTLQGSKDSGVPF